MGLVNILEGDKDHEKYFKEFWKPLLESAHELDAIIRKIVGKTEAIAGVETSHE